jgi:hypothetical protein
MPIEIRQMVIKSSIAGDAAKPVSGSTDDETGCDGCHGPNGAVAEQLRSSLGREIERLRER